jgi:hypothetical protein
MVMIEAQLHIPGGLYSLADVNSWLIENVGIRAPDRDWVTYDLPWASEYRFGVYEYYFAREEDATLFALKWGVYEI